MTRKDLLQVPGLGPLIKLLDNSLPATRELEPPPKCPPNLAAPGEVWRVVEPDQVIEDQEYSPTNPHCSTVLILAREENLEGEHTVFRVAPVLADLRFCGVQDAIFPREVFGYEAAVACGCEFTLTSKELERSEGVLPDKWFDLLADFAAWMEAEDSETAPKFPPRLKTGRPFTHTLDPGYIFHSNLATNLQPLMATALEVLTESAIIPGEDHQPETSPHVFASLEFDPELALAAGESNLPEEIKISHLLPGFTGFACESVRQPGEATEMTFSCPADRSSHPPSTVVVSWPTGSSSPSSFRESFGGWMVEIEIEVPWKEAVSLLGENKIIITPVR